MLLSRQKPAIGGNGPAQDKEKVKQKLPKVADLLENRDYTGAITLLEFEKHTGKATDSTDLWIAYCFFHLGQYKKCYDVYLALSQRGPPTSNLLLNLGCCCFYLGMYKEAHDYCKKADKGPLQNRLMFHISHKFGDEFNLLMHHSKFEDCLFDQMCLASLHYMRGHYNESVKIFKQLMTDDTKREFLALNVYVALCYYKLDYYDVSQEVLAVYLQHFPDSAIALNLKACNHFRLYNGKAAEAELRHLQEIASPSFTFAEELLKHNLVVFRSGEGALQTLPPLVDVMTEARLNLVIYYLKQDDILEAYNLIKDIDPSTPQEYILKGVVNASLGQEQGSREHLKIAQQYFQLVGGSASECGEHLAGYFGRSQCR